MARLVEEPLLGLATTSELLDELHSRFTIHLVDVNMVRSVELIKMALTNDQLEYRTVDGG